MSEEKCYICGSKNTIFKIQVKLIEEDRVTFYQLSYCYGCWKDSFGEYIIDELEHLFKSELKNEH